MKPKDFIVVESVSRESFEGQVDNLMKLGYQYVQPPKAIFDRENQLHFVTFMVNPKSFAPPMPQMPKTGERQ